MRHGGPARRWVWRAGFAAAVGVGLWAGADAIDLAPRPLPLVGLVFLGVAVSGLVVDALSSSGTAVWVPHPPVDPRSRARDPRTGAHLHVLEAHLAAKKPDGALAQRLVTLADQRLRARHGVTIDSAAGRELLGDGLDRLLDSPQRRLKPADVDQFLHRIERL